MINTKSLYRLLPSTLSHHFSARLRLSVAAWGAYFVVFNLYCLLWRSSVLGNQYSVIDSQIWFLKEWGPLFVLTPLVLGTLEHYRAKHQLVRGVLLAGLGSLLIVITVRQLLNSGEFAFGPLATTLALLPKYFSACLLITAFWWLLKSDLINGAGSNALQASATQDDPSTMIEVEHRGLIRHLDVQSITCLKAAGNYVELCSDAGTFLKRAPLSQLLTELPPSCFLRVHRSHVVNRHRIASLNNTDNGGAILHLKNGLQIPVSKRYKSVVKLAPVSAGGLNHSQHFSSTGHRP